MKTSYIVSLDGSKIAYNVFGKGDAILLVHGMGATKEIWIERGWVKLLEKYFTVITIDIRGNGESDKSYNSNFYSIENILNDIHIVLKKCGFSEYNYFGHSYGATIGLQLASLDKNLKKVICGGTIFGDEFFKNIVPEWIDEYEKYILMKKNNLYNEENLTKEDIEWIKATDLDVEVAQLKAWKYWRGIEVSDIETSLAIYSGSNDNPLVLENLSKNEDEIKKNNITLKIFENLDHGELISKIDIVSPWILEFLLR